MGLLIIFVEDRFAIAVANALLQVLGKRVPALRRRRTFCMLQGVRCISHQIRYWVFCFCGSGKYAGGGPFDMKFFAAQYFYESGQIIIVSSYFLGRGGIPASVLLHYALCWPYLGMWLG